MKYLKLNEPESTIEGDFGKYIYYDEATGKMTKKFAYDNIEIQDLITIYSGMRAITVEYVNSKPAEQRKNPDLLLSQWARSEVYNDETWTLIGGSVDENLVSLLYDNYFYFPKIKTITLDNFGKDIIKAPHFWATVNTYFTGHGDLGGWAGDTVDFAKEIKNGVTVDFPLSPGFSADQWRADSDAHNIYNYHGGATNFLEGMRSYYGEKGFISENERVREFITAGANMAERFINCPDYTTKNPLLLGKSLLEVLMLKDEVTMEHVNKALDKIQKYINKNK